MKTRRSLKSSTRFSFDEDFIHEVISIKQTSEALNNMHGKMKIWYCKANDKAEDICFRKFLRSEIIRYQSNMSTEWNICGQTRYFATLS